MVNLLIADDERAIRNGLLSQEWGKIGVRVIGVASNGIEAMEMVQNEEVDIVLTDIRMPGMDGIELTQFIAKKKLSAKVILLSGYSDFLYAQAGLKLGVFDYLLKPSDPDEILSCVLRASDALQQERTRSKRTELLEKEIDNFKLVKKSEEIVIEENETTKDTVQVILKYIMEHFQEEISLTSLSEELHFTSVYLSRILKKETGHSFLKILTSVRMYHAARLLKDTSLKISVICNRVGIGDQGYFSQVFRKCFGVSPNDYRANADLHMSETQGQVRINKLLTFPSQD